MWEHLCAYILNFKATNEIQIHFPYFQSIAFDKKKKKKKKKKNSEVIFKLISHQKTSWFQ